MTGDGDGCESGVTYQALAPRTTRVAPLIGPGTKGTRGSSHENASRFALAPAGASSLCHSCVFARTIGRQRGDCSSADACLRAAPLPGTRPDVDARLLGLRPGQRLLLGSRHVGSSARARPAVDARLLGLVRRPLFLP